jgi:hypothetical protein
MRLVEGVFGMMIWEAGFVWRCAFVKLGRYQRE